jgi:Glycosyl transferase family 2
MSPLISVIVPLYNKAQYISRALHSLAGQTLRDIEVIVVDDGSTDGSDAIAAAFLDPRFRIVRQKNAGPGAARNSGLREALAPYVAFLDADDCWHPSFLETNFEILENHPEAAAAAGGWLDFPGKIPCAPLWKSRGISEGIYKASTHTPGRRLATLTAYMTPCTVLARTAEIRRWNGFHEHQCRFAEDSALWVKVLLHSPVYFHLVPLTELHRGASELSGNYRGPRPIEPYLESPDLLRASCPEELRDVLDRFLAIRACKTACMLSYWGEWRRARALTRQFLTFRDWRAPLYFPALLAATPLGGIAGRTLRSAGRRRSAAPAIPAPVRLLSKAAGSGT